MTKRIVSILLTLCLVLAAGSVLAELTPVGEFPIATGNETLTVWASSYGQMQDFDNLEMTKWYEEKTGVHINWIEVPNADRTSIFNTSIASGDYPDIYMQLPNDLITAAADGVIIPLEELIDNYSVYLKAKLDANPDVRAAITAPDGHIYAFPKVDEDHTQRTPNMLWVYTAWMEEWQKAAGKDGEPQTPEELEEMLLYFKANDMNGNGDPNDEIIITGNNNYGMQGGYPLLYIMGGFTFCPIDVNGPQFFYVGDDGKTTTEAMSDDWREGLKYCARLYSEGLIGSEAFTQTLVEMRAQTSTTYDQMNIACIPAPYAMRAVTASSDENAVKITDYTALTPLSNYKTGEKITPTRALSMARNRCCITTACKNPELALRWIDLFYSDEVTDIMYYKGWQEKGDWGWVDGVTSVKGENRAIVINNTAEEQATMWDANWIGSNWISADESLNKEATDSAILSEKSGMLYISLSKDAGWPYINWCTDADLTAEFADLKTLMVNDILTAMSEFAMGIRDINDDAVWEAYKKSLYDDGFERFLEVCDAYFNLK